MHNNLIRWFADFCGSTPVEFESSFPIQKSVTHLKSASKSSAFMAALSEGGSLKDSLVGHVSESRVCLRRFIPGISNAIFNLFFVGSFQQVNGKVILSGNFTMHWLTKIFLALWFVVWSLFIAFSLLCSVLFNNNDWIMAFYGIGVLLLWYAIIQGSKGMSQSKGDAAWLSKQISKALKSHNPSVV